jgi:ParB family transcriptional regulator, chromosome partitioning protein
MEQHQPHRIEVEIAALVLRYAHTRIVRPKALTMMTGSMERFGQINPVLVIVDDSLLVLIDGYLRVQSLKRLGRDTVMAEVCQDAELKALFGLLSRTGERQWEAVEQAWILRDIKDRFGCTASEMARSVGHDLSWVSKRLALLETLSDEVLHAVCQGHVSTWAATRVLVPLARANPSHAENLTCYLAKAPRSCRDLASFLTHYESSNRQIRDRMIHDPGLFFRTHKSQDQSRLAKALDQGPEGEWIKDCGIVTAVLRRLLKRVDTVIYPGQDEHDRSRLFRVFCDAQSIMNSIAEKIRECGET